MNERTWHTSSYSGAQGDCVEVSEGLIIAVRDTRNRELGHLGFTASEWTALLGALDSK
ncbi:DUF397 domain-containing protein [Nocardiopsis lambiniae]|uniref:DUF397 domain-containing protein n=1 Tax=Nocardiopsis lambiniae TaxID=3075539 RepID=A0ABU2MFN5_9ACTN|nr:DUF397 domain-containing protein [Nocardiopsis sp. DSM 44743]MDT0331345.1 DUF397 domain-containing protein [Nocardiopsis sp. DSM 44743]